MASYAGASRLSCCRFYNKAFGCIPALRKACIEHNQGKAFNTFLEQMASKYEHDRLRADFWKRVMEAKISLISNDELADVEISKQEAEAFVKQHTPSQQVQAWIAVTALSKGQILHGLKCLATGHVCVTVFKCQHCAGGDTRSGANGCRRGR